MESSYGTDDPSVELANCAPDDHDGERDDEPAEVEVAEEEVEGFHEAGDETDILMRDHDGDGKSSEYVEE